MLLVLWVIRLFLEIVFATTEKNAGYDGGTYQGGDAVDGQCSLEAWHAGNEVTDKGQCGTRKGCTRH